MDFYFPRKHVFHRWLFFQTPGSLLRSATAPQQERIVSFFEKWKICPSLISCLPHPNPLVKEREKVTFVLKFNFNCFIGSIVGLKTFFWSKSKKACYYFCWKSSYGTVIGSDRFIKIFSCYFNSSFSSF